MGQMGCRVGVSFVVVCEVGLTAGWSGAKVWRRDLVLAEVLSASQVEGCRLIECGCRMRWVKRGCGIGLGECGLDWSLPFQLMVVFACRINFVWTVGLGSLKSKSVELCGEEGWLDWSASWCAGGMDVCLGGKRVSHSFAVDVEENAGGWDGERMAGEVL